MKKSMIAKRALFSVILTGALTLGSFVSWADWEAEGSSWYYYDDYEERYLTNEWFHDTNRDRWYYLGENSAMMTGWVTIDGYSYYLEEDDENTRGAMYANTVTPDGSIVGVDGVKVANPNEKFIQN